jgi:arylsulfatase A-like enzyme
VNPGTDRRSIRRATFLFVLVHCAALLFVPHVTAAPPPKSPPNIIVILADDLGWADLACYGGDLHETPHLDRLARQGVRFTDAYSSAPICSPTRAALLTGQHPARLHFTIWREAAVNGPPRDKPLIPPVTLTDLPKDTTTLAEMLQGAGYLTALVGKWHLGDADNAPEAHGFEVNIGGTHWGAPPTYFSPYRGPFGRNRELRFVPHLEFSQPGEYLTDRLTDEALRVIDRAGDKPFFLYLAHHAPHTPIEGKPSLVKHFEQKITPQHRHQNPGYAAMVASLDESVGRIMGRLEERQLADNTVVVFTSDNGGFISDSQGRRVTDNTPLRSGKGSLYEGGIRVPLLVRGPPVASPGTICREPVATADLFYTLLELGRIPIKDQALPRDGQSLISLLKEPESPLDRDTLYFHYPHYYATTTPVSSLRAGDWKLLEYHETDSVELYNLKEDLGESKNLATDQPDRAKNLRNRLHAWRTEVEAQMPTKNPK